jgi:endonuclease YncB( thermonuclease family)
VTLNFQKDLAFLLAMAAIISGFLSSVLGLDLAMGTSGGGEGNSGGDDTSGDDTSGDDTSGDDTSGDDTSGDGTDSELQPDPDPCLEDPNAEGCEEDPCIEDPTLEGCGDPCIEDPTLEGCEPSVDCNPSYNICVPSPPPNLNCDDISDRNFEVVGNDPHGFDRDNDGIGCEGGGNGNGGNNGGECDPSYPEVCIPSPPPDLDCGDTNVPNNVRVVKPDPHRLDGDNNGIGCESSDSGGGSDGGSSVGSGNRDGSSSLTAECQGQADCFRGAVTEIVDGDTIDINNVRVRLALTNTPERGESGYSEAIDFVESVCSVGTRALVDEDDGQKEGSFSRLIGLVYCGDSSINNKESLNELLLERGYAIIDQDFCTVSEFSSVSWAQRYGC